MFIKNPNQKESYSFRIKSELLENLKAYAKATNQSLPETLNNLLEEAIDGVNTSNTFLTDTEGIIINIPLMYHNKQTKVLEIGTRNYLDYQSDGLTYEVKQIPNNLDTWSTKGLLNDNIGKGYYSKDYPEINHEGVNLVIIPELILNPELNITEEAITNCLKFIYFQVDRQGNTKVSNINYKYCFKRLKEAGNEEILYKFKGIDNTIYKFSLAFMKEFNKDPEAYTRYDNYRVTLYNELVKLAGKYNDNTIVSLEEVLIEELENSTPEEVMIDKPDGLVFTSGSILTEILEENQALQNRVNELETKFNKINELIELSENPEYRAKVWESIQSKK